MTFLRTLIAVLALTGLAAPALAAPVTIPTSLNPGDQYRLAFVTAGTRDATSTDIADYNAFVTAQANLSTELAALGTTWTAIASTSAVDARDNTGTNPSVDGTGVPIYVVNDLRLADDNSDLWGTFNCLVCIDTPLNTDQNGNLIDGEVWTGTTRAGWGFRVLGTTTLGMHPMTGLSTATSYEWTELGVPTDMNDSHHFYAFSGLLTIPTPPPDPTPAPEPSTVMLFWVGLAGLVGLRRRRVR
ncbi:MAG: PEP-CTERM sorting domain-containing protein [Alphaproteobacteria bacterium]|jgi:hypothetical protein|nr:PEP-CTERM sorting domain-containing protein [Alphaproteobacteria bacterium]MDP6812777.1 PEP-CTERM sorting domain-containing protein [Alphaproteobacteria bacterium]